MAILTSLNISCHQATKGGGAYVKITTYGMTHGSYGSLGVVYVPCEEWAEPTTKEELARFLLTALYGGTYAL